MYNAYMNIFETLENVNAYISFNIFAVCGWLYLPILVWIFTNFLENYSGYPIEFYLPLSIFLLVPWLITITAFIMFLIESLKTTHLTNDFFCKNKYFKVFKYVGFLITITFYLIVIILVTIISEFPSLLQR